MARTGSTNEVQQEFSLCVSHTSHVPLPALFKHNAVHAHDPHPTRSLTVSEDDHLIRFLPQLALDEAQQVLLVHAGRVVDMGVHLENE